jgi:O-methyltransferase involved in polyketide biosynthesis
VCEVSTHGLPAVPRTLLIPLAARAEGGRWFPWLECHDAEAVHLLDCMGVDPGPYLFDRPTVLNVLWRTHVIKQTATAFFAQHPQAQGVNLGAGLSHHFQWLDTGRNHWLDADLPAVMALRDALLPAPGGRLRSARTDLTQPGWWDALDLPAGPGAVPVLLLLEGVLMYLTPAQVQQVLHTFAERAGPGSLLLLDAISALGVGRAAAHYSVGPTGAQFQWGLKQVSELTAAHPRLQLQDCRSVAEAYGWAGLWTEACWRPWLEAPLYSMATLRV